MKTRCKWANSDILIAYHDNEWGMKNKSNYELFERLSLEIMQAGLKWETILNKREEFRNAFDFFNYNLVAKYDNIKVERLLQNKGIIRNRIKINSIINNAKIFCDKDISSFIWAYDNNIPEDILIDIMIKDLKKIGIKFIGYEIIKSTLQAIGFYNSHDNNCYKKGEK